MAVDRIELPIPLRLSVCVWAVCLTGLIVGHPQSCHGQRLVSQLHALSRCGGQVGSRFDLSVTAGADLDEVDTLYFSHPDIAWQGKTLEPLPLSDDRRPDFGNFVVTIPSTVQPGRYEVRVGGRHGVSNPRAFLVTTLPHDVTIESSHDPLAPQTIALNTLISGTSSPAEIDYYEFELPQRQSVRIDLLAQRIDSKMIGHFKLFDQDGRRMVSVGGADDLDPILTDRALEAGRYLLAVHDFTYRGGATFHYQLLVRPAAGATDLLGAGTPANGRLPRHWMTRSIGDDSWKLKQDPSIQAVPAPNLSSPVELPLNVSGWFPQGRSDLVFPFRGVEGRAYSVDIISERLGEPTDPRLIIERIQPHSSGEPQTTRVLMADDSQSVSDGAVSLETKDATALFQCPSTADYQLLVRDLDDGTALRRRQRFYLQAHLADPRFELLAYRMHPDSNLGNSKPGGSKLVRGGAEVIRVFAVRRDGWDGPITVTVDGLPAGVTAEPAVIGRNQSQTQVTLLASDEITDATKTIRVVGHGRSDPAGQDSHQAAAATIVWGKGNGRDFVQSRIATDLYVATSPIDEAPLSVTFGKPPAELIEVKKGDQVTMPVVLIRRDGGQAACTVRARDLPPGFTAGQLTIGADKSEGEFQWKVSPKAEPGEYSLWLQVETKIKVVPDPQRLERAKAYRAHLQRLHDDPKNSTNLESIRAAIEQADKMVESAKAAAQPRELTAFLPSPNTTIRVFDP